MQEELDRGCHAAQIVSIASSTIMEGEHTDETPLTPFRKGVDVTPEPSVD